VHKHMAATIDECVEMSHLKHKITAVIPTSTAPVNCLMWSVFSLLLRTQVDDLLEHFCVCINGPDERTGDPTIATTKQRFLEELRDLEWCHPDRPNVRRPMPLTVIRVWSRVGHSEPMQMALPWVHTDAYLLLHDDVFIRNANWTRQVKDKFYGDDNVALTHWGPLLDCKLDHHIHRGMFLIRLPQMNTTFLLCKKKWTMKAGGRWTAMHIPSDDNVLQFDLPEVGDVDALHTFWKERGLSDTPLQTTELYNFVRQDVGAWMYYGLAKNGHTFNTFDDDTVIHLAHMTIQEIDQDQRKARLDGYEGDILELENLIAQHPPYSALYNKYKTARD